MERTEEDLYYIDLLNYYEVIMDYLPSTIQIVGVVANLFVIVFMLLSKNVRQNSANNFVVATLSSDAISCGWFFYYYVISQEGSEWRESFSNAVVLTSINLQIAMTVDRFWAICYPLSHRLHQNTGYEKAIIGACIGLGLVCGFFYGFYLCVIEGDSFECIYGTEFKYNYTGVMSIWVLVSIFSMLFFNGSIICFTIKRTRSIRQLRAEHSIQAMNEQFEQEKRITVTMLMIIMSFCICWIPYALNYFLRWLMRNEHYFILFFVKNPRFPKRRFFFVITHYCSFYLTFVNSLLDPLIYVFRMRPIRNAIRNSMSTKRQNRIERHASEISMGTLNSSFTPN